MTEVIVLIYYNQMSLTLLLLVQVMISLLNGLFDPATRGMLPQLVEKDQLTRANSTVAALRTLSLMLGPVIGAVLYGNFGVTMLFFVNGISFLLSGISEMMIRYIHVSREAASGIPGIFKDWKEGIKYIAVNKIIKKSCWFFLVTYLFVQRIFQVVLPLFVQSRLACSDTRYGFLQSILVFGMLLGSFGVSFFFGKEKDMLKPLTFGSGLLLASMLIFSILLFPNSLSILGEASILYFAIISIILCLFSASILFIHIPVQTFIQKGTPDEYMSRVFSLVNMISRGGTPFGSLLYGIILEVVEVQWTIMAAALFLVVITIILLTSLQNTIKCGDTTKVS